VLLVMCCLSMVAGQPAERPAKGTRDYASSLVKMNTTAGMVEAKWANEQNSHDFLRLDLATGSFVHVNSFECRIRDAAGKCLYARAPLDNFEEMKDPMWIGGFDGLLDRLTLYFLLRSFKDPSKSVDPVSYVDGVGFQVSTRYVNDARGIPYEIYERSNANRLTSLVWTIPSDFSFVEKKYAEGGTIARYTPSERSPPGAWLLEHPQQRLKSVRTLPSNAKAFTIEAARDAYAEMTRVSERRKVFSKAASGDPLVASPMTQAEIDAEKAQSDTPAWRWPLLGAGALIIVAAWIARRRAA
jgi:hypothetical protein